MGQTRQAEVWRFVKANGLTSPKQVAQALGFTPGQARSILQRLEARGSAVSEGYTHLRRYRARGPEPPQDRRGKSAGTALNLARGRVIGNIVQAQRRGRLYVPQARHPLDRVWRKVA